MKFMEWNGFSGQAGLHSTVSTEAAQSQTQSWQQYLSQGAWMSRTAFAVKLLGMGLALGLPFLLFCQSASN